ncbi:2OG-Fe(II) oxygenase [Streptomyces sp. NPDC057743]|uniref:2OG-Fe(II) oxygenase n=1 Tax=Streptomyces sp. NPDC057743 TaxID=3346236 RepID=UPI0036C3B54E
MTLLNLAAIGSAPLSTHPYPHAVLHDSFADHQDALVAEFPTEGFHYDVRDTAEPGRKRYRTYNYQLVRFGEPDQHNIGRLSPRWRLLLDDLTGTAYRTAVSAATGADLTGTVLDIRLVRYADSCWIEPHVDRPDKVVTHLFYLNAEWQPRWSGALRVLRSADIDDCSQEVFPLVGTSVLMVRTEHAWHAVPPVTGAGPHDRKTLLVHFARPADAAAGPGQR